jgi:DNA-binding MarR family transcriptional regulator
MKATVNHKLPSPKAVENLAGQINSMDFWLCQRFTDITRRYIQITMTRDRLSHLQSIAMWELVLLGGTSTPTQLAHIMFRSKHSMTLIIDNLEKAGLVIRDNSSEDRRVIRIRITAAGLEYVSKNVIRGNEHAAEVMSCLDTKEQKSLVKLLARMRQRMIDLINDMK